MALIVVRLYPWRILVADRTHWSWHLILRDHVLVDGLIVYEIAPSGSGVDSSWNSSRVDRVLVETLIVKRLSVVPWIDMCSRNCYGVGIYYNFIPMFLDTTLYYIVTLSL